MKKNVVIRAMTAMMIWAIAAAASAQPANDLCGGATPVFDGDNPVSNIDATQDTILPATCIGFSQFGRDVWYSYTAPATGVRNFEITNYRENADGTGTARDSILSIYDACNGTLLRCDNDGARLFSRSKIRHFSVTGGANYIIRFSNLGLAAASTTGSGTLKISVPPTPVVFDDCELATPVAGEGNTPPFDAIGLTNSDTYPWDCNDLGKDGWYAWTPSLTGIGVVDACSATRVGQLSLGIYESCGGVPLICSGSSTFADPPNAMCFPKVCFDAVAGHVYYIRVGGASPDDLFSASGTLALSVRPLNAGYAPPVDAISEPGSCDDAREADLNGGCANWTGNGGVNTFTRINLCETRAGTASSRILPLTLFHPDDGQTVLSHPSLSWDEDWYEFTLATDDTLTITGQTEFQAGLRLVTSPCPGVQVLSLNNQTPGMGSCVAGAYAVNRQTSLLTAGTYYLAIATARKGSVIMDHSADCVQSNKYWFRVTGSAPCPPPMVQCCRGTTCQSMAAGSCTGTMAGSASVVVSTCGAGGSLASCCYADYDHSGTSNIDDLFIYINSWLASSPYTKIAGDGVAVPSIDDLFVFINLWLAGCS